MFFSPALRLCAVIFCAAALSVTSSPAFAAARNSPLTAPPLPSLSPQTLPAVLRAGHPRLIVLDDDIVRVRALLKSDPVARKYHADLIQKGEKMLAEPPAQYVLVGPRLLDKSRLVLTRVETLATLYRLDGDTKWAERAKKELMAAANFPDWHPAHFLDTAEMTHAFAIGYDWLYPTLSPDERKTIKTAIVEKGLRRGEEAYRGTQPWKWWTTVHHNWNQVCNGGMILGALAVGDEEPELSAFILQSALKSLPLAMASFAPDGGWNEGPGYWSYTTAYTVPLIAGLESAVGSDFGLATTNGFDRTGAFRLYFVGPTGKTFNYADAGDGSGAAPVMRWMARRYNAPLYNWEANRGAEKSASAFDLLWYAPVGAGDNPQAAHAPLDTVFRGVDVAFLRSEWADPNALWVGFKGGDNTANHSHADLGTFVFDALGQRWANALGSDNYNLPDYFGKARWTYYRLRTEGQNAPVINNENQNIKAKAPLIAFSSKPDTAYAVADLSAGYAANPSGTGKVWRGVALVQNRRALLVQDEVEAGANGKPFAYQWQMHTQAQITPAGDTATLTLNGKTLHARILFPAGAAFSVQSAAPPAINGGVGAQQNPNKGFERLVVKLPASASPVRVAVLLTPDAQGAQTPAAAPLVTPLADWVKAAPPLPRLGGSLSPVR